ncbi:tyrosine-type recombinase/integrase [Intrasporangium sp. YIM S08009]|uniref:tyrosine-type recombinase/integrase n=1 Tax=Intrasporangium zincisolvens TaxID=3080018 RepID=UPI002B058E37|nr:tyrosine-type recombinase/integrase [Intrasporangium sp. YIM S08009]
MATRRKRREFGAVRQLPSGRWQASYLAADGLRRTAPNTFRTKADAHAWLTVRQSELLRGDWLDPDLGRVILDDYATKWIVEHRISARTRDLYEGLNRLHIRPILGHVQLGSLTTERVRAWRAELLRSGRSEVTTAKAYRLLRAVLNTAVDDGRIARNPCRIKGADQEKAPERPVASVAQVFALADAVGPQFRAFVLTAALTSMRWGELIALRRRDLDLEEGLAFVHRSLIERGGVLEEGPPKNNSVRVVTLPALLVDELRKHMARVADGDDALVFTGERGATPRRGKRRANVGWAQALVAAGLPEGFHFHDLRHTGNHLVAQSGASTRELMHRMGHSTMRAALIYQHATESRSRALADRLNDLVAAHRGPASEAVDEGT